MKICKLWNLWKILKEKALIGLSPYVEIGDISISWKTYVYKNKLSIKWAIYAIKDSILISKVRPTRGAISIVNEDKIAVSNAFFVIYPEKIIPKLLFYFLAYNSDFLSYLGRKSKWTLYPSCKEKDIEDYDIPVPSPENQLLILSEIEKQFSRLDEWLSSLLRIRENLRSYRASLLKSAVEWRLTAEWRAENPDIESADILFDRIHSARRKKWISENPGKKYREPEKVKEWIEGVELPKEYSWARLEEITTTISDWDHSAPPKANKWIPFITIWDITKNKINFSNTFFVWEDYFDKLKITRRPLKGDVLYTVTGSFGIPVLIDFDFAFCFQRHIWLIRPTDGFIQNFLFYLLQSNLIFSQANKTATWTAQKTVWLESIRNFKIPLPPLLEQNKIVEILEEKFSVIDSMESLVNTNIKRTENLKQAILKKAFSGELITE